MSALVRVNVTGFIDRPTVTWPDGWPVPRVGEPVRIGDDVLFVHTVTWYPAGVDGAVSSEPFVYVVLGPPRR